MQALIHHPIEKHNYYFFIEIIFYGIRTAATKLSVHWFVLVCGYSADCDILDAEPDIRIIIYYTYVCIFMAPPPSFCDKNDLVSNKLDIFHA